MAKYNITYACGHEGVVDIIGPGRDRDWKLRREESKDCPDCWRTFIEKKREDNRIKALKAAEEMSLPELTGTEKQVAWAVTIRQGLINKFENLLNYEYENIKKVFDLDKDQVKEILHFILENKTAARYFIDNREFRLYEIIEGVKEDALKSDEERAAEQAEKEAIAEIRAEATVYPKEKITNAVAEISFTDDEVSVSFERNETFRQLVRELGYRWEDRKWRRRMTIRTGAPEDRAAELGNKLLNAGFPIMILEPEVRQAAITGDYEPEHKRWIGKIKDEDRFAIGWTDGSDMYGTARSLPGSKWERPFVTVSVNHFEAVEEFAELYGFKFTQPAIKMIEKHKESLRLSTVVDPAKVNELEEKDGLSDILESSDDIIDDLKD